MEKIEDLCNELYEKLSRELREYKKELREKNVDMVIRASYETTIKEQFPDMVFGKSHYNEYELRALLDLDNSLNGLYNAWMDSDLGLHNILEDTLADFIMDLADEYVEEQEDKIKQKDNYELISNISEALTDFDRYDYNNYIKNKYEIEDFDLITVDKILNSRDGVYCLYHHFDELKDNYDLKYLNQTQVINSNNYQNIEDKIIPELKKIIVQKEKNNKVAKSDIER